MSTFLDELKSNLNKRIHFSLDDNDPLMDFKLVEVGDDYVKVEHGPVHRIIPISKITYIQEQE